MRRIALMLLTASLFLAARPAGAKMKIVCTIPDLCDIAANVGGNLVTTSSLGKGYQDPHFVDPKPSFALALRNADLLLLVGLELEVGWLPPLLTGSRNSRLQVGERGYLDCSTLVKILEVPSQKLSRAMGDLHPGGNPHYWMDPRNGVRVAFGVYKRLAQLDPGNTATYERQYKSYALEIVRLSRRLKTKLAPYAGSYLIPYHQSMIYFITWAGLRRLATIERLPGVPPSAAHLAKLHQIVSSTPGRKVVVSETYYPDTVAKRVAAKYGLPYLRMAHMAGGLPGAPTYAKMLEHNADRLAAALAQAKP
ncbi:MAG: metal ABC transporter substrate-binding protein [Polyangia bacterium]|nr:metal ABC transporter substrate-binding protein [Polyangia bacterium]